MHPTVERLLAIWTHREVVRDGAVAIEAEARLRAALARRGAAALYPIVQRNAHAKDGSYAKAIEDAARHVEREGFPPSWAIGGPR